MAEGDIRQLESLQRTLIELVKALQKELARSNRTVEKLPEMIQASTKGIADRLQDQINFQGELEIVRSKAVLAGKNMLLAEEQNFLEEKKDQLRQDVERLLGKYAMRQNEYDQDAKSRVLKLDSHVDTILNFYCDNLMPLKYHEDEDLDKRMNTAGADVLAKRQKCIQENLARQYQGFMDFYNKRKALSQQIQDSQSPVQLSEKMEIYLPFFLIARSESESSSCENMAVVFPGSIVKVGGGNKEHEFRFEENKNFEGIADQVLKKMKNDVIQKRINLRPPYLVKSLKSGLAKLIRRDYFVGEEQTVLKDFQNYYDFD